MTASIDLRAALVYSTLEPSLDASRCEPPAWRHPKDAFSFLCVIAIARCFLVTRDDEPRLTEEKCNLAVDMAWSWRQLTKVDGIF